MTTEIRSAMQKVLDIASPGPWAMQTSGLGMETMEITSDRMSVASVYGYEDFELETAISDECLCNAAIEDLKTAISDECLCNAAIIVASRMLIPELLAELDEKDSEISRLKELADRLHANETALTAENYRLLRGQNASEQAS